MEGNNWYTNFNSFPKRKHSMLREEDQHEAQSSRTLERKSSLHSKINFFMEKEKSAAPSANIRRKTDGPLVAKVGDKIEFFERLSDSPVSAKKLRLSVTDSSNANPTPARLTEPVDLAHSLKMIQSIQRQAEENGAELSRIRAEKDRNEEILANVESDLNLLKTASDIIDSIPLQQQEVEEKMVESESQLISLQREREENLQKIRELEHLIASTKSDCKSTIEVKEAECARKVSQVQQMLYAEFSEGEAFQALLESERQNLQKEIEQLRVKAADHSKLFADLQKQISTLEREGESLSFIKSKLERDRNHLEKKLREQDEEHEIQVSEMQQEIEMKEMQALESRKTAIESIEKLERTEVEYGVTKERLETERDTLKYRVEELYDFRDFAEREFERKEDDLELIELEQLERDRYQELADKDALLESTHDQFIEQQERANDLDARLRESEIQLELKDTIIQDLTEGHRTETNLNRSLMKWNKKMASSFDPVAAVGPNSKTVPSFSLTKELELKSSLLKDYADILSYKDTQIANFNRTLQEKEVEINILKSMLNRKRNIGGTIEATPTRSVPRSSSESALLSSPSATSREQIECRTPAAAPAPVHVDTPAVVPSNSSRLVSKTSKTTLKTDVRKSDQHRTSSAALVTPRKSTISSAAKEVEKENRSQPQGRISSVHLSSATPDRTSLGKRKKSESVVVGKTVPNTPENKVRRTSSVRTPSAAPRA